MSPSKPAATFQVAEDPVATAPEKKAPKSNADSGYHGLPEDDMDVHDLPVVPQSSAGTNDTMEVSPKSPPQEQPVAMSQSEGRSTADRSFHSAKEELTEKVGSEKPPTESHAAVDVQTTSEPTGHAPVKPDIQADKPITETPMDMDLIDKDLDADLVVDESRSPSQESSPARPLTRKSSLTFAPLPPRDFTAKRSIGTRASQIGHLDQSKGNIHRGSLLDQLKGGKSLGGTQQPEFVHEKEIGGATDIEVERPGLPREESDTDSKMTKLHAKSSTQRLHDRINMLGKSQPARPTKSIPPAATAANVTYPELSKQETQPQLLQNIAGLASKAVAHQTGEEEDDEWIQPPQIQPKPSIRPELPKSTSVDVMENIKGKQTISGGDFDQSRNEGQTTKEPSPLRQPDAQEHQTGEQFFQRTASLSHSTRPALAHNCAQVETDNKPTSSTTPTNNPSSQRYVDGPLSASKSKLQSIMKTARGLFSSSAGVSAQAKMETLSPASIRIREETQATSIAAALNDGTTQQVRPQSPIPNPVGRKTRSSTEKEAKRKESEAKERSRADGETIRFYEQESENIASKKGIEVKGPTGEVAEQHAKPTRQSPRKTQTYEGPTAQPDAAEEDMKSQSIAPLPVHAQSHQSQLQRPKDMRRPQKPAKEAVPKSKPPPVAIKVISHGMRMNNALSTNLQESLPPPQPRQPSVAKKPSNPSLHPTTSNSSLKSTVSATVKPKALIAAERKKELVRSFSANASQINANCGIG